MRIAKKLLSWTLIIALLGVVINFAVWFMYTRQLTNMVNRVQTNLKHYGVDFVYEDLIFNNFKSWKVRAQIKSPSFVIKSKTEQSKFSATAIDLEVTNFSDSANVWLIGSLYNENENSKKGKTAYMAEFTSPPHIHAKMKDNLALMMELLIHSMFDDKQTSNIGQLIHKITYEDQGLLIYDITDGKKQPYYSMKAGNMLSITNLSGKLDSKILLELSQKDTSWFPEYKAHSELEQRIYNTSASLGKLNCTGQLELQNSASEATKERWRKTYGDNYENNKEITPVFEVTIANFKNMQAITDKFSITINGRYNRQTGTPFPYIDFTADVNGKHEFLTYYQQLFNSLISRLDEQLPALAFKQATDEQIQQLEQLLSVFAEEKDAKPNFAHLHLVHNAQQEFTLNGRPAVSFITQFLKIFADNMTLRYPIGNMRPHN